MAWVWFYILLKEIKTKSFIEVMGQHSLGAKQSIVVVKIKGQQFVLGVTSDHVQLITQIDADENEVDVLDDPAVSESIGKMFGSKPTKSQEIKTASKTFDSILKSSNGANAVMARNAYQQVKNEPEIQIAQNSGIQQPSAPSVRDQIKRRLEGMRNL